MAELPADDNPIERFETLRLIVAWIWVGVPLAWGVSQTVIQSLRLFR